MKYIDLTTNDPTIKERNLSQHELRTLIKNETNRDLIFDCPRLSSLYDQYFTLVRMPSPIGFVVAANQLIPAGTLLFPYGGETVQQDEGTSQTSESHNIEYRMRSSWGDKSYTQQAKSYGDLGSLLTHLPNEEFLEKITLLSGSEMIQKENCATVAVPEMQADGTMTYRLYFEAMHDILPGSVIGFDYGVTYWMELGVSPLFFKKGAIEVLDNSLVEYEGLAVFKNTQNSPGIQCRSGQVSLAGQSLMSVIQGVQRNYLESTFVQGMSLLGRTRGARFFEDHLALTAADAEQQMSAQVSRLSTRRPLLVFFRCNEVISSCAPPPGSAVVDGITRVNPTL